MSGALTPITRWLITNNGIAAPGAKLYTYLSGTSTPHPVYNNADLAVGHEHTNPVIADSEGVLPVIYLDTSSYRFVVTDSAGATIFPAQDDILHPALPFVVTATGGIQYTQPTVSGSGQGFRITGPSPAIEFLDNNGVQNWYVGISDSDSDAFQIGRGYGPGQGLTPSVSIDKTALSFTIGDFAANSPDAIFNIRSHDGYGQSDWLIWTVRDGATTVSNHSRFQHFSGSATPEVVHTGIVARGSRATPTAIQAGDPLFILDGRGYDATATAYGEYANGWSDGQGTIRIEASENWSNPTPGNPATAHHGTKILFYTTPNSAGATQIARASINPDGVLEMLTGGIKFPPSQVASSDANTLDDYEETTWTVTIGGSGGTSGQTYSIRSARAIKIGRLVYASFVAVFSGAGGAKGTITGNVQIQGLPYTATNDSVIDTSAVRWANLGTNWVNITAQVTGNTTTANLRGATAAAAANTTDLTTTDIADNSEFRGTIIYEATA